MITPSAAASAFTVNKRAAQFDGIMGLSNDLVGTSAKARLTALPPRSHRYGRKSGLKPTTPLH
jgi:hypothetical protein